MIPVVFDKISAQCKANTHTKTVNEHLNQFYLAISVVWPNRVQKGYFIKSLLATYLPKALRDNDISNTIQGPAQPEMAKLLFAFYFSVYGFNNFAGETLESVWVLCTSVVYAQTHYQKYELNRRHQRFAIVVIC